MFYLWAVKVKQYNWQSDTTLVTVVARTAQDAIEGVRIYAWKHWRTNKHAVCSLEATTKIDRVQS